MSRLTQDFLYTVDPLRYVRSLRFTPFEWQEVILQSPHKRKIINGARQSGKSTIISTKPCHKARFWPGSLSIVLAATEKQAVEDMEKIKDFIASDPQYPEVVRDSDALIELNNGSRILVVPATPKAARGFSAPDIIIMDEASRIEDMVYTSGVRPMLTDNAKCELLLISTPNGRTGFFFKAFQNHRWERYEVRSPWEPAGPLDLAPYMSEDTYRAKLEARGIRAWFSPRHRHEDEQGENLEAMGQQMYRQEMCCEFVEPEEQVFSYSDIERAFSSGVQPLAIGSIGEAPVSPFFSPQD